MARSVIPNPLARRHVLERDLPPEQALRIAEAYLEKGRTWEALAFLVKADARERLEALREQAVAEGDAFLLREVATALERAADPERWRRLGEAAAAAGKERYAAEAQRQAGRGEG